MQFRSYFENVTPYPTIKWIVSQLRNNIIARVPYKVLAAYIVGSEAKGTARPDSDLDVAVVFYANDPELATYSKIPLN
jgi:predicted nucleotidyltransferase